ncbi:hypothetical protein GYB29_15320, partial [bacterium]|nr:hypothetical protein [bacterium]
SRSIWIEDGSDITAKLPVILYKAPAIVIVLKITITMGTFLIFRCSSSIDAKKA